MKKIDIMKASVYRKYGLPNVLDVEDVEKPIPQNDEVLIKIYAAGVNSWDWDLLTGKPYLYRLVSGLFKPKDKIIGSDVAGIVESVGENVKKIKPGDEVYGDISPTGFGAFAEFVCTSEKYLAHKPKNLSFEEAAAIPQAGLLAFFGLKFDERIKSEKKILINGAGGGVGTFALQLAKLSGAEVTCVDSPEKFDLLRSLGADHFIDYKSEDFTKTGKQYDFILDNILQKPIKECKQALADNGTYVVTGGKISKILSTLFNQQFKNRSNRKKIELLIHKPNGTNLEKLNQLLESGKLKPIIHKSYPLNEVSQALWLIGNKQIQGNAVIKIKE